MFLLLLPIVQGIFFKHHGAAGMFKKMRRLGTLAASGAGARLCRAGLPIPRVAEIQEMLRTVHLHM